MSVDTAILLTGGDPAPDAVRARLPEAGLVIAADSGLHAAERLGLHVDLIVGDLDSADPAIVAAAIAAGSALEHHPQDKDATDLELGLEAARARGVKRAVVVGGASFDRIDHFMANALLLAAPAYAAMGLRWHVKGALVVVVHYHEIIEGSPGDTVTLLATGGPARGVTATGLKWPLHGNTLEPGSTLGVSNVMTSEVVEVAVDDGTLLVFRIDAEQV